MDTIGVDHTQTFQRIISLWWCLGQTDVVRTQSDPHVGRITTKWLSATKQLTNLACLKWKKNTKQIHCSFNHVSVIQNNIGVITEYSLFTLANSVFRKNIVIPFFDFSNTLVHNLSQLSHRFVSFIRNYIVWHIWCEQFAFGAMRRSSEDHQNTVNM